MSEEDLIDDEFEEIDDDEEPVDKSGMMVIDPDSVLTSDIEDTRQAKVRIVELTYNTPDKRMPELTRLNKHEAGILAMGAVFDDIAEMYYAPMLDGNGNVIRDKEGNPMMRPISVNKLWRGKIYSHRRSVGGEHLDGARKLAEQSLMITQEETSIHAYGDV